MKRYTRTTTALVITAALTAGGVAVAVRSGPPVEEPTIPAVDSGVQPSPMTTRATNCRRTYTNKSGIAAFNWCYSDDGNIVMLENSAGLEHIGVGTITEGWCVAASGSKRGQTNGTSSNTGLQDPIYTASNNVVHKTLDGDLRIEQQFSQKFPQKRVTINMKVKNVGESTLNNVFLTRFVDADMSNTTSGDVWTSGSRAVSVGQPGSSRLTLVPRTTKYNANSMIFGDFLPILDQDCYNATADTTNEAPASDRAMGVLYQLGNLFPGQVKSVKFDYYITI